MINVTKTYLPPFEEYVAVLKRAWDSGWITNNGILLQELEAELKQFLSIEHLLVCSNGTVVLQMALKALGIKKEVITTPFSYVATVNAILWEGCKPVFVDIRPDTFCIDERKIEAAITENTEAILATHVYGFPCDVDAIEKIAVKYNLKVIYDGAHAFGARYKGKSLLDFGDVSTCSFHATKIFHTVEGGAIICNDKTLNKELFLCRSFGHIGEDYFSVGINAKNSELHAAMGLCILHRVNELIERRKKLFDIYKANLKNVEIVSFAHHDFAWNYGYCPVLFKNQQQLLKVKEALAQQDIFTRRYFYPSINTLPYVPEKQCPISEDVASKVLTMPMYYELSNEDAERIAGIVNENTAP